MIDLITYFINSTIGIIIITSAVSALTAVKFSNAQIRKYTGYFWLDETIEILKITAITTIAVLIVIGIILGLINLVFNSGLLSTPDALKFVEVNITNI